MNMSTLSDLRGQKVSSINCLDHICSKLFLAYIFRNASLAVF